MGLLGDIGSSIGGFFDIFSANSKRKQAQGFADKQARQQNEWNKDFAQNSIQWRANDAKAAGLHPLAALGASPASGGVSTSSGYDSGPSASSVAGSLGQAIDSGISLKNEKILQENATLKNELLKSQIRNIDGQTASLGLKSQAGLPNSNSLMEFPFHSSKSSQILRGTPQQSITGYEDKPSNFYQFNKLENGNILRSPSKDLPDAYSEGPLSIGLGLEMFRPFTWEEKGQIAKRLVKEKALNPNTQDLVEVMTPIGRALRVRDKNDPTFYEKIKGRIKKFFD